MIQGALKVESSPVGPHADLVFAEGSPLGEIRRACARIGASDATVLLTGETGTGKEVFARLLHGASERGGRPFVPVNCGAIPEALLESELFGFVKGAFTGAVNARKGRVAMAEGGTLFLDEIGELPLSLQVKLLRLLQEKTYEPVGSSESVSANFRLVAATNRDLGQEVRAGRFRRDLYYRLHVCPIRLPALRERPMDVAPLFLHFWRRRGEARLIAPAAMRCLEGYSWPGNVRELENLVERLSVCSEGQVIELGDLPPFVRGEPEDGPFGILTGGNPMRDELLPSLVATPEPLPERTMIGRAPAPPPPAPPSLPTVLPSPAFASPAAAVAAAAAAAVFGAQILPASASTSTSTSTSASFIAGALPAEEIGGPSTETQELVTSHPIPPIGPTSALMLPVDLPRLLRELEAAYIGRALAQTGGNKKEAAKLLGMGRTTLVEKLRRRNADTSTP